MKRQATGEINPSVPYDKLGLILVPVPKRKEDQLRIVEKINEYEERIEKLKIEIQTSNNGIYKEIRGNISSIEEPCERAKKLGSEFIKFI